MPERRGRPAWFVDGKTTPFFCWTCKGNTTAVVPTVNGGSYSICEKCNPEKKLDLSVEGCEGICIVCYEEYTDPSTRCTSCEALICEDCKEGCISGNDEDGDYIMCIECSE